jgi:hypothetical protein
MRERESNAIQRDLGHAKSKFDLLLRNLIHALSELSSTRRKEAQPTGNHVTVHKRRSSK